MQFHQTRPSTPFSFLRTYLFVGLFLSFTPSALGQVEVWTRQFGSTADPTLNNGFGSEAANSIATDSHGNVLVTGRTSGIFEVPAGSDDVYLRRYDSAGILLWTRQFGTANYETNSRVGVDAVGNSYVLANTGFPFDFSAVVFKFSPDGVRLWTLPLGAGVQVASIAVDAVGNFYLAGLPIRQYGPSVALGFRKYDSDGHLLWVRQLPSSIDPSSLAIDVTGSHVYIAGNVKASDGTQTLDLRQYTSDGVAGWSRQFGIPGLISQVESAAVDGIGDVLVAGWTAAVGPFGVPAEGSANALVAKYDSAGTSVWVSHFGTSGDDVIRSVATHSSGEIYVGGETTGVFPGQVSSPVVDVFIARLGPLGDVQWTRQFGSSDYDFGGIVAVTSIGNIIIGGGTNGTLPGQTRPALDTARNSDAFVRKYGTAAQAVSGMAELISELSLNAGNQNALVYILSRVDASLGGSNTTAATNQLLAFKNSIIALQNGERIDAATMDSLTNTANQILDAINSGN